MGAEDFSYVLEKVPGCHILLGARPHDVPAASAPSNHSAIVRFDDTVLGDRAAALAELGRATLAELTVPSEGGGITIRDRDAHDGKPFAT